MYKNAEPSRYSTFFHGKAAGISFKSELYYYSELNYSESFSAHFQSTYLCSHTPAIFHKVLTFVFKVLSAQLVTIIKSDFYVFYKFNSPRSRSQIGSTIPEQLSKPSLIIDNQQACLIISNSFETVRLSGNLRCDEKQKKYLLKGTFTTFVSSNELFIVICGEFRANRFQSCSIYFSIHSCTRSVDTPRTRNV